MSNVIIKKENNPTLTNKYADWESFRATLEERINLAVPLKTTEQIDHELDLFVKDIQSSAWECTPTLKPKVKGNNYSKEIRKLIKEKRKLRRIWQQTRASQDKTNLNKASQQLKREIQNIRNESIKSYFILEQMMVAQSILYGKQ